MSISSIIQNGTDYAKDFKQIQSLIIAAAEKAGVADYPVTIKTFEDQINLLDFYSLVKKGQPTNNSIVEAYTALLHTLEDSKTSLSNLYVDKDNKLAILDYPVDNPNQILMTYYSSAEQYILIQQDNESTVVYEPCYQNFDYDTWLLKDQFDPATFKKEKNAPRASTSGDCGIYVMTTMNAIVSNDYEKYVNDSRNEAYAEVARIIIAAQLLSGKLNFNQKDLRVATNKLKTNIESLKTKKNTPSPKKVTPKKVTPKKVTPKKVTPKKVTPKKVTPQKVTPKKVTPQKVTPKKVTPKKVTAPKKGSVSNKKKSGASKKTPTKKTPTPRSKKTTPYSPGDPTPIKKKTAILLESKRCECFLDPERSCGSYSRSRLRYDRTMLEGVASKCGIEYKDVSIDTLCLAIKNKFYQQKKHNRLLDFFQEKQLPGIKRTFNRIFTNKLLSVEYIDLLLPVPERLIEPLGYQPHYTAAILTVSRAQGLLGDKDALQRYRDAVVAIRKQSKKFDTKIVDKIQKRSDVSTYILARDLSNKANIDQLYITYLDRFCDAVANKRSPPPGGAPPPPPPGSGAPPFGGPSKSKSSPSSIRNALLSDSDEQKMKEILVNESKKDKDSEFKKNDTITITAKDIRQLRIDVNLTGKDQWLEDNIINFFFNMIQKRSQEDQSVKGMPKVRCIDSLYSTYPHADTADKFMNEKNNKGIFDADLVLLPYNIPDFHWVLVVANFKKKRFEYYDSLFDSSKSPQVARAKKIIERTRQMFETAKERPIGFTFPKENDHFEPSTQQTNDFDCGVFVCTYADCLAQGLPFDFTQYDIPRFRLKMVRDIQIGQLTYLSSSAPTAPSANTKENGAALIAKMKDKWEKADTTALANVLSMYTYDLLGDTWFVKVMWKYFNTTDIYKSAKLVLYDNKQDSNLIKQHLVFRHPITRKGGDGDYTDIDYKKVKEYIGDIQTQASRKKTDATLRYGVLHFTPLARFDIKELGAELEGVQNSVYMLHTWGVNLEAKNTVDARYVFKEDKFNMDRYRSLLGILFTIVRKAATHLHTENFTNEKRKIVVRMPGLGLGRMEILSEKQKEEVRTEYMDYMHAMVDEDNNEWLTVRYPHDNITEEVTFDGMLSAKRWVKRECNGDPYGDFETRKNSTLIPSPQQLLPSDTEEYCPLARKYPADAIVMIVNEWNDSSFIGGGGSRENTMNGWTVAGGSVEKDPITGNNIFDQLRLRDIEKDMATFKDATMGANAKNISFLFNVFFRPQLLDTKNWLQ